ncbi:adenine phosphoribosyltransferase [Nonlabens ponticola]|uniref:Adenine phosphoribosyltransferase n=2 Tax=Nonlabens ponticola TaxID=2496866 RepID=A0A3S9N0F5_9FLAO|nr:adenine phosphoribosyltransferase [Nonlabens ponticola]
MKIEDLKGLVQDVPDFPQVGIVFKDISPLLASAKARKTITSLLATKYKDKEIDVVVGMESRGFLFGTLVADALDASFVMVRKPGKLPGAVVQEQYDLEYGQDTLEIQQHMIPKDARVLIHDDVLATGGTALATSQLIEKCKGTVVGYSFLIELDFLAGRKRLKHSPVHSLIHY